MFQGREKRVRRSRLSQWLGQLNPIARNARGKEPRPARVDRLKLETLEKRQLLAGDVSPIADELMGPVDTRVEIASMASSQSSGLVATSAAEGEPAPDLVQFAKDLTTAGVIFYGANWCPACSEQKALFQDGRDDLPFIEVTNPDRSIGSVGIANNITAYPTWVFPNQTRQTGVLTLQQLSTLSGVPIPQSEDPTFEPIGTQTVLIGSPLHVPVDAYDPNGGPLTVTVSVSDSNLLQATVIPREQNRSIRIDMETFGDMVIQLFEQRAPTATGRVIQLANDGFYDDIIFHRVIDDFVIQGGDPTGTGTSGSTLGNFDDDFHPELQHNRSGVLSFAKSSDDTNNSQFFITEVPTRFLDFNHSVFGQLIEGEDVRDAISEHAVNGADRPTTDVAINTIEVFTDTENSLIMLKPTGNGVGSTSVTVTVTDGDGNSHSETFQVDVNSDTANSQPYLNAVTVPAQFPPNTPATLQLSSTDVEGDAVTYSAVVTSSTANATASINQNGLLTVTPTNGFTGEVDVRVTVRPGAGVTGNSASDSDNQDLTFKFEGEQTVVTPTSIDLVASSDSGSSNTDNITNAASLSFTVTGVTSGATVQLINLQTSAVLGSAIASGTSVTVTTNNIAALGQGTYNVTARQIVNGLTSAQTAPVSVTFDTSAPASVIASANTRANVGRLFQTDLISPEEGSITYALTQSPTGATINSGSGLIQWTPAAGDVGDESFGLSITDLAGNTLTETFTVTVAAAPLAEVKLVLKDTSGNVITGVNVGQDFILELVGVDARGSFDRDGVFAIYADILFDSTVVRVKGGSTIERVGNFTLTPKGTVLTGLIDELGAASTLTVATGAAESIIARVQMEAIAAGSVNIRSEEADESSSEILLYGEDNQIPAASVLYGNANLTVGLDFTLVNDTATVAEDSGATTVNVLANDTTTGSGSLSVVSVTQPTSGGIVAVNGGVVTFTPTQNFNGSSVFTYRAGNSSGAQSEATVTVTVTPVNDPPDAVADTFEVIEATTANRLNVLANDSFAPDTGETLTVTAVNTTTTGATVAISSDALAVNYTPAAGFVGTDSFTYTISDGQATDTVTVTVTVTSSDAPPTAVNDAFNVNEDTAEASYNVLQNDTRDTDNQTFILTAVGTPSQGGTARISSDGSTFFYTPKANFFGTETVTYTIRDTGGGVATGTATFTVADVEDAPPVLNDTRQVSRGSTANIVLRLTDLPANVDGSSETLTLSLTTAQTTTTQGGTAAISGGNITYTPPSATFTGTDTLVYTVSDGSTTTSTGTLTIEVLDLTQRNITVQFSGNQAAMIASAVRLTGTDVLGNAVSRSATTSSNDLLFSSVLPGSYVVEIPAIPFFSGAEQAQQYSINAAAEDGDATVQVAMGRIRPEYISIQDWLGSAPRQSALVVAQPGSPSLLTLPTAAASQSITNPQFTLNAAGTELTLTGTDDNTPTDTTAADTVRTTILTSNRNIVRERGQVGDLRLYQVNVADNAVTYTRTPASTASTASSGEGELIETEAADLAVQSASTELAIPSGLVASGTGEGELVARSTSSTDVTAPMLNSSALLVSDVLTSDASKPRSDSDESADTVVDPASDLATGSTAVRRLTASDNASGTSAAPSATSVTNDAAPAIEDEIASTGTIETSSLSANRVDRFFRGASQG